LSENARRRLRPLLLGVLILVLDAAILLPALLSSRLVIPSWKKGPLIDPAAPYSPENAIVLAAVAVCIAVDVYLLGLFLLGRRLGKRPWLPALMLVLALVAAEGSLRAWLAVDMVTYFRPHPTLHWQVRPNLDGFQNNKDPGLISTNRDGMREVGLPRRKAPDEYRILVLGDSSNFGHGVAGDEMWSSVLEDLLAPELRDRELHVLNGACPGWTTYQARVFLDEIGLAYQPDMVIAGFNNDPGPDYLGDAERLTPEPVRTINGVLWRSELYLLAREAVLATARRLRPTAYQDYSAREAGKEPEYGKLAEPEASVLVPRVPMGDFLANLRALEAQGRGSGFDFVWVDMPINRSLPDLMERYVNQDYRDAVSALSLELGFPVVEVDRAFRDHPPGALHLRGHVFHPSPRGHATVARLVADALLRGGLLPGLEAAHPRGAAIDPGRLRFGCSSLTPVHAHVAVVLAEHPELMEQAGLDMDLQLYESGKTQGSDVAAGALSAYFTCGVPAAHMLTSGPGARVVASPGELGRIAVVARRDAASDLAALRGARVGLVEGSTPAMDWEIWGQDLGAVVVPLKTEDLEDALREGRVDAVVGWDPWVEQWLQAAPDQLVVVAERPFWSALAMDPRWVAEDPARAAALAGLIQRALALAAEDRAHYDQAVAELSGWPVEVVRAVADRNRFLAGRPDAGLELGQEARDELIRAARFAHGPRANGRSLLAPELLDGVPTVPAPAPETRRAP
jgi:ABC-type nitrate/sulfonate/bicarbonate transport system substrate-binding protein